MSNGFYDLSLGVCIGIIHMEEERLKFHLMNIAGCFKVKQFTQAEEALNKLIDEAFPSKE